MCFTKLFKTEEQAKNYSKNPLIAKEDIMVNKMVNINRKNKGQFKSIWYNFIYENGKEYILKGEFGVRFKNSTFFKGWHLEIHEGFHSYPGQAEGEYNDGKIGYINCIIPKGSKYFYSEEEEGLYVSDRIRVL